MNMKKIMAGALASLLAVSMTVTAFAEDAAATGSETAKTPKTELADGKQETVADLSGGVEKVTIKGTAATVTGVDLNTTKLVFGTFETAKDTKTAKTVTVAGKALKGSKATSLTIAATTKTVFNANALAGASKLTSVTVKSGKVQFKKNAFKTTKKLTKIYIKNIKKAKNITVAKGAFKKAGKSGNGKKITIYVSSKTSKKELKKIKDKLKKAGFTGKVKRAAAAKKATK